MMEERQAQRDYRSKLMPEAEEARALIASVGTWAADLLADLPDRPIGPSTEPESRRAWLAGFDFAIPHDIAALVEDVAGRLQGGLLLSQHPACFGLFNPAPAFPAILADLITAVLNPQLAVSSHAPLAVEIEAHLIRALCARIGLDPAAGHFTSGGAEANSAAALLALGHAEQHFGELGTRAFERQPLIYTSRESHSAWFKIAHQLGIGRKAVRLVDTDGSGRMDPEALRAMLRHDRAHSTPALIVATAGTTNAGMIDPLPTLAEIARENDIWFHVDAAWAGALVVSDDRAVALAGIEAADSVTIDAHKWLSVPMGAGMFLTRHPAALAQAFRVDASYMPAGDGAMDPYLHSGQWSRRFIGLKLFLTLAAIGWSGYGEMIDSACRLAERLRHRLLAEGWRIENDSPAAVICFNHPSLPADRLVAAVQARQKTWISLARFEERPVIRACITSFRCTEREIDLLVSELALAAECCSPR